MAETGPLPLQLQWAEVSRSITDSLKPLASLPTHEDVARSVAELVRPLASLRESLVLDFGASFDQSKYFEGSLPRSIGDIIPFGREDALESIAEAAQRFNDFLDELDEEDRGIEEDVPPLELIPAKRGSRRRITQCAVLVSRATNG